MLAAGADYADARPRAGAQLRRRGRCDTSMTRIVYLGGLGETGAELSEHLSSRREVERELAAGPVPVTTLRAAMIIGSGSASFEILRYLVERLPVMVTPRWVQTESQPIAVRNVLDYLVRVLEVEETTGRILDIGGPEVLSYRELMRTMAEALELPKRLDHPGPGPHASPQLALDSPGDAAESPHRPPARRGAAQPRRLPLERRAHDLMPQQLLERARGDRRGARPVRDRRASRPPGPTPAPIPGDPDWAGGTTFVDRRVVEIDAAPADVFRAVCRIGGGNGWYAADLLWRLRGWMDRLVGGPGLRRGRRDPEKLGLRRRARLLASHGHRGRPAARAARRDEAPR